MEIESIETLYHGTLFRSRLEARWAVFWDCLNISYEYEPKKFDFGEIKYIPDFWLPQREKWVEIKGKMPEDIEIQKARLLANETKKDIVIFSGLVQFQTFVCSYCADPHYVTIPCGVGITYFWGNKGTMSHINMQIDEFNFAFLGRKLKTHDLHVAFLEIQQALLAAHNYRFSYQAEETITPPRKTIEQIIAEFSEFDPDNTFE